MGPLKLSYPCNQCEFEATSARQLSRHKAVTHVKNPLTCILCPFVTAYQTNLLRHRREVHGILGSKGNKSCKFCGFEADDNDTLILHQQQAHQDILKSARERFAREKKSARGPTPIPHGSLNFAIDGNFPQIGPDRRDDSREDEAKENELKNDDNDDRDFWKEGFLDNPPNLLLSYNSSPLLTQPDNSNNFPNCFNTVDSSSPISFETTMSEYSSSRPPTPLGKAPTGSPAPADSNNLAPTKIRRQYSCGDCGFRTVNPREFLYHRRDVHDQKVKIVECPYCVYACQYFQKLQRHMLLVHKLETSMTPPAEVLASQPNDEEDSSSTRSPKLQIDSPEPTIKEDLKSKEKIGIKRKSSSFDSRLLTSHIIPNMKRRFFRCSSCGYATHVQYLFKKHLKYHNAPKIKCDMCDFESPYSWNVERHSRSHRSNGAYKCLRCSFSSDKPQAITVHVTQHHRDKPSEEEIQQMKAISECDNETKSNEIFDRREYVENQLKSMENMLDSLKNEEAKEKKDKTKRNVTYVRKADGKIVAKPGIMKRCKYCNYQADSLSKLQKHEAASHPEKRFQCPLCEIRFENLVWLQRHLMHMHKEDTQADNIINILELLRPKKKKLNKVDTTALPKVVEPNIEAESNSVNNDAISKKLDKDKNPTTCRICGYETRWVSELQKHMRVHTKEKPFICPYCSFRSKWKGDLNRHIQKYHSMQPMPHLDEMEKAALKVFSNYPETEVNEVEGSNTGANVTIDGGCSGPENEETCGMLEVTPDLYIDEEDAGDNSKPGKVKIYDCCYCDFTCTTASRFHVHFVQHLNTKPFMCSVCGHRSNWEWDVTKHIKMKSQRDSKHSDAKPVLIHDSGKRDYRKYNKYLIWVNQEDVDSTGAFHNREARDPKAKRIKLDPEEAEEELGQMEEHLNDDDSFDPESIVVTPDITFAVNDRKDKAMKRGLGGNFSKLAPNVPYLSNEKKKNLKPLYCAYCDFSHVDSKYLVSHLSIHAGKKPYKCGLCEYYSNWKEVIVHHLSSRHDASPKDVVQTHRYIVNKHIARIIDESGGSIDVGPELPRPELVKEDKNEGEKKVDIKQNSDERAKIKSKICSIGQSGRFSGFKGSYKCDLCPFRAEKQFHMQFHNKRHAPVKGADFKCPHCPYWVNAKKSLTKHIYLHDYENEMVYQSSIKATSGIEVINNKNENDPNLSAIETVNESEALDKSLIDGNSQECIVETEQLDIEIEQNEETTSQVVEQNGLENMKIDQGIIF